MTTCGTKDYTSQIPLQIEVTNERCAVVIWGEIPEILLNGGKLSWMVCFLLSFLPFSSS